MASTDFEGVSLPVCRRFFVLILCIGSYDDGGEWKGLSAINKDIRMGGTIKG